MRAGILRTTNPRLENAPARVTRHYTLDAVNRPSFERMFHCKLAWLSTAPHVDPLEQCAVAEVTMKDGSADIIYGLNEEVPLEAEVPHVDEDSYCRCVSSALPSRIF